MLGTVISLTVLLMVLGFLFTLYCVYKVFQIVTDFVSNETKSTNTPINKSNVSSSLSKRRDNDFNYRQRHTSTSLSKTRHDDDVYNSFFDNSHSHSSHSHSSHSHSDSDSGSSGSDGGGGGGGGD